MDRDHSTTGLQKKMDFAPPIVFYEGRISPFKKDKAMRFQINVDCTPDEVREFFALPDLLPFQQAIMDQMNKQLAENMKTMEPEKMIAAWSPLLMQGWQGWGDMQKNYWAKFAESGVKAAKPAPARKK